MNKGKTVLILGNGFDLAHNLPTKYSDFLKFCEAVQRILTYEEDLMKEETHIANCMQEFLDYWKMNKDIISALKSELEFRRILDGSDNDYLEEIYVMIEDNVWYEYFQKIYKRNLIKGENWIDFESEIRFIIKEIDQNTLSLTDNWDDVMQKARQSSEDILKLRTFEGVLKFDKYKQNHNLPELQTVVIRDVRKKLFEDLDCLTRALEVYLAAFVNNVSYLKLIKEISDLNPDYIINFNYTDTYQRVYKKETVYHIHGKSDINHSVENNNMVLGIDEYWSEDEQDQRTNFTIFKKFAQRIQKKTGNENYKYLEEIRAIFRENSNHWSGNVDRTQTHSDGISYVYVFGHSLDVTDKDILSSFIGDDATSVVVYCKDRETEGELIANTVKLIGEKRLLEKSNHVPSKLQYKVLN